MVRETRYLLVRNIPEKSTEESINHYFQRYGKIQSVKIQLPAKESETTITATVAFMDIRSASKAHSSKNTIDSNVLRTEYWDALSSTVRNQGEVTRSNNSAAGGSNTYGPGAPTSTVSRSCGSNGSTGAHSSWTAGSGSFQRHGGEGTRAQADLVDRSRSPDHPTGSLHTKKSVSMSRSASRSRSRSPRSRSGSSSSRTVYSTESSNKSCSKSQSHDSSQGSARMQTSKILKSTIASVPDIKESKTTDKQKDSDSDDRRPLGICITGLPSRSSVSSLRDGLFHEYKKHGKVTTVQIVNDGDSRHAIISFRKPEDASKALEASQGKMFFGTKIKVTAHEGIKVDEADIRTYENDLDEFHPKSTRTLFVGNLEKDTTVQDLMSKFRPFGDVIDVDIKRQGAASAYAFVQYTDISSVVQALREMEGEHIGANKIKLGFGKSMPTNCVWIDGGGESLNEKHIYRVFKKFGEVIYTFVDRKKWRALVFFTSLDDAQFAVNEMKGRPLGKRSVMIDFASRECQNNFLDKMEKTGQMRPENRPDERGLHKFRQRSFEFQEGFTDDSRAGFASTSSQRTAGPASFYRGRLARGRNRHNDGSFQDDFSPSRRSSRQSSEFNQSGTVYKNVDDYEQELREYGHSQRERRERCPSPRHDDYDDRSGRSSREVSLDCYDSKEVYTRSSTPSSEHNSFRSERYVARTVEEKSFRTKYEKDKSEDKVIEKVSDGDDLRGQRSPVYVSGRSTPEGDDLGSESPPTPTEAEEPFSRTFYPRNINTNSDFKPTYTVIDSKPKLKSIWVSQTGNNSSTTPKLGSEVTLPEKSSVRKRLLEDSLSTKDSVGKKKSDRLSVGSLTLKMTPAERERQRKQRRSFGKTGSRITKGDAKSRIKGMEIGLGSPGSSGSHPESENGSLSESELQNLQLQKQKLLVELGKEDSNLSTDNHLDGEKCEAHPTSRKNCHKQIEQITKMELKLKEKQKQRLTLPSTKGRASIKLNVDFKVSADTELLDCLDNSPSDSKRRKVDSDCGSDVVKQSCHKDNCGVGDNKLLSKGTRTIVEASISRKQSLESDHSSHPQPKDLANRCLPGSVTAVLCKASGASNSGKTNLTGQEKVTKGVTKQFLSGSSMLEKNWTSHFGPSPEACFSPAVSEEAHEMESNNSESLKSSPKPLSPLGDWRVPTSTVSPAISDDDNSRLGSKISEPGLSSLAHIDDSLSDSSGEESTHPGEPSLEDRIRMVDEIMNATMNKTPDVSNLTSAASGVGVSLSTPSSNLTSSLYAKYRIRKRVDAQSPGQGGLSSERKNEPSEIMMTLLRRRSILDQDYKRLGQQSEKFESALMVGQFGMRPSMDIKSCVYGVGRSIMDSSSMPMMPVSSVLPVNTASASMQQPTATTTTSMAGQPITTVTTSLQFGYPLSFGSSVTMSSTSPSPLATSPRSQQSSLLTALPSSIIGSCSAGSTFVRSPQPVAEPLSLTVTIHDKSYTPASVSAGVSHHDNLSLATTNTEGLRTQHLILPVSGTGNFNTLQPVATVLDLPVLAHGDVAINSNGSSSKGVESPSVIVNSLSTISAVTSVSPTARSDAILGRSNSSTPTISLDTSRNVESLQTLLPVSAPVVVSTVIDQTKKDSCSALLKKAEKEFPGQHNEGLVSVQNFDNSSKVVTTTTSFATSVMHSTSASTSSVTSSNIAFSSLTVPSCISSSIVSVGKSQNDRPSKSKTSHNRSFDQTVKHDPLFAPDIKPETPKLDLKTLSSRDKTKGSDLGDKQDMLGKFESEPKERKSHGKSSQAEKKLTKSSKDIVVDRTDKDSDKQDQKSLDRSRPESGSRNKTKEKEEHHGKGKETDSHSKTKEKESIAKHNTDLLSNKEIDSHFRDNVSEVSSRAKEDHSPHPRNKDKKVEVHKAKDKDSESHGKEIKESDVQTKVKESNNLTKVKDIDTTGKSKDSETFFKQKDKDISSHSKSSEKDVETLAKNREKLSDSHGRIREGSCQGKNKETTDSHNKGRTKHKEDKGKRERRDESADNEVRNKSKDSSIQENPDPRNKSKEKNHDSHKKEKDKKLLTDKKDEKKVLEKADISAAKEEKKSSKEEKKCQAKGETKKEEKKIMDGLEKSKDKAKPKDKADGHVAEIGKQDAKQDKLKIDCSDAVQEKKKLVNLKTSDNVADTKEHKSHVKETKKPAEGCTKSSSKAKDGGKESTSKVSKVKDSDNSKISKKSKSNENEKMKERQKKEEEERRREEERKKDEEKRKEEERKREEERKEEKKKEEEKRKEEEKQHTEERKREDEKKKEEQRRKEGQRKKEREKQKREKEQKQKKAKEKEKQKDKEKQQKEKEKDRGKEKKAQKESKKEKEMETGSSSSKKGDSDNFDFHAWAEPVYTSMYDTIKRRSCTKTNQINEISSDTRKKLDKLQSRRGSTKKSNSRAVYDSSSDDSDQNLLSSLESDSDKSDSDSQFLVKKKTLKKKAVQQPLKKKRAIITSSSDDEEEEVDEAALLRTASKSKQISLPEKKNFKQIFSSSSDSEEMTRESSPERLPPRPILPAKSQEKKKINQPKKHKLLEDSNDSDIPELQPISKAEKRSSSHLGTISDVSMSADDDIEKLLSKPGKKAQKKKVEEKQTKQRKSSDDSPPAKKLKRSTSGEGLVEKEKEKSGDKKPVVKEEKKIPALGDVKVVATAEFEKGSNQIKEAFSKETRKKDSSSKPKKSKRERKERSPVDTLVFEEPTSDQKKRDVDDEKKKKKKKVKKEEIDKPQSDPVLLPKVERELDVFKPEKLKDTAVIAKHELVEEVCEAKKDNQILDDKLNKTEQKEKKKRPKKAALEGEIHCVTQPADKIEIMQPTDKEEEKLAEEKTVVREKVSMSLVEKISHECISASEIKKETGTKQEKDKEKKEKKAKLKVSQTQKSPEAPLLVSKDNHSRDPILQTLADDMERLKDKVEKKDKLKDDTKDSSQSDDLGKYKPKKKKKKKDIPEKSPQSFAISSLVAETVMKQPEPDPPAPAAEAAEDLDPFVSFWGHPAPLIHKKRDSIPKPDDGKEKEDKEKKADKIQDMLHGPGKTPVAVDIADNEINEMVTDKEDDKSESKVARDEKHKPGWSNLFGTCLSIDQDPKPLISIPEEAFKPVVEDVDEKSDTEVQTKPKKKKIKKKEQRKGSKEIDPLAAVEMCLEATKTTTKDDPTVLLQDVIDKKAVFPERRFSYEDNISIPKESSPLFSPAHKSDKNSPKQQDSKEFADLSQPEDEEMGLFRPFTKPERVDKVPFISTEQMTSVITESDLKPQDENDLVHIERNESDEQAASDEAARAVQALVGGLEEDSQFNFDAGENIQMTSINPEPTGVLDPAATPTSPSTALTEPITLQGQPETAGPVIPEATEAPQATVQPGDEEQSLSIMEQLQQQSSKAQPQTETAIEFCRKGQMRRKKQKCNSSKDLAQKEEPILQQPEETYAPKEITISETHLPDLPDVSKAEHFQIQNRVDAYDFDKPDDATGVELIVESAVNAVQPSLADEGSHIIKSPQQKNSRGRRGRGVSLRDTPEKMSKVDQAPTSPAADPLPGPIIPQVSVIPLWQQGIVKDDLASPESKTDLDSSYGEAELVINLEDQGTPTDGEERAKSQYQFGSDTEEKTLALQTSAVNSPYKTQRPSRMRKPTNYKAMDQGLNMNIPSPRTSRSGSSPRAVRGGQSPKSTSLTRGRGSPKASTEMGSPIVKLEKLEVSRRTRKDEILQKGRSTFAKESEGNDSITHQSFEDWKASMSTVDLKPICKDNIYEFEASEQEQKLEPSPLLRGPRGRKKRMSESTESCGTVKASETLNLLSASPAMQPIQPATLSVTALKELGQEEQASDDSTSSMSNVDKIIKASSMSNVDRIIDAVSKGIFDVSDHTPEEERISHRPAPRGRSGRQAVVAESVDSKQQALVTATQIIPSKNIMAFSLSEDQGEQPAVVGGAPLLHKGKGRYNVHKLSAQGDMVSLASGFSMSSEISTVGQHSKPVSVVKQEIIPITTMTWQTVPPSSIASTQNKSFFPQSDKPQGITASSLHGISVSIQPHSMPQPSHSIHDAVTCGKKGESSLISTSEIHVSKGTLPSQSSHTQNILRSGTREESSPLLPTSSTFITGHSAGIPDHGRRTGIFAIPSSRDQPNLQQNLISGPPISRGGAHEPRYTSPQILLPMHVIATNQNQVSSSSNNNLLSSSSLAGHNKPVQHIASPPSMPPVPALVQSPHSQLSPKLPHAPPKAWAPGSLPCQQSSIHTPPPPSPSQISPTSAIQPQRPQSVQLPVIAPVDLNQSPLSLKRPPSAHNNQPVPQTVGRDRPGRPPSHHSDMRPPSLPGDVLPHSELTSNKCTGGNDRHERELERDREREHLVNLQRTSLANPKYYMIQGDHCSVSIPHGLLSQHDSTKSVNTGPSLTCSIAGPASITVTTPSASQHTSRRGSLQDSVPCKVPPATSASALYSGVVASQPHSLSPKTASPVGQVIERLPNPIRPHEGMLGPRSASHVLRGPAPPVSQDPARLARLMKEESLRGLHPPAAHGEEIPYQLLVMQMERQRAHHMLMQQELIPRSSAARSVRAQELAHSSAIAQEMAAQEASARKPAQEAGRNPEKEVNAALLVQEAASKAAAVNEATRKDFTVQDLISRSAIEGRTVSRVGQEGGHKGPHPASPHGQMIGIPSSTSVQQVPLNLADSDSRGSSNKPPYGMTGAPSFIERDRSNKGNDRPLPDTTHLPSSAFIAPPPGHPSNAHREGLPVYGGDLPFGPFGMPRMGTLDPRVFAGQHHPQFLPSRDGVLHSPFQQFVSGAGSQRFQLDQHLEADRLLKKGEMPSSGLMSMGRSPSPVPSPSPRLPPEMISHSLLRMGEMPTRENLQSVLGRYPMVWQGMLALKNDQSYVQMHFVSGSKDLPDQALPQVVFSNQALPLRISQRMRLETPNLEGVTKRMMNEKDYTLLLAVPCGMNHMDITDQTKNLTVGFIEYLRSKLAAGIVNVSQPGTNQPAFVVHVFPPCEFSMQVVASHSQGLVEQIHDLAHVIIIITTV